MRVKARDLFLFTCLVVFGSSVVAGVATSKHNLGDDTTETDAVCVFCHTPHGANVTFDGAPLWNKPTAGATYQRYSALNTSTLDGAEAPVGSVSLACLSCHDGTQAMDVVINVPGAGGWNPLGTEIDNAAIGFMPGTGPVPNLTEDLRDDHPISIQYAGGGCSGTTDPACTTLGDPDFNTPVNATINGTVHWWLDTAGGTAGRDKTDIILYSRDTTGIANTTGEIEPFVECASCHDPHNDSTGALPGQVQFLRLSNASSAICTACHIK